MPDCRSMRTSWTRKGVMRLSERPWFKLLTGTVAIVCVLEFSGGTALAAVPPRLISNA
jgi:hypothetical protein